jgi:hypothetical protein
MALQSETTEKMAETISSMQNSQARLRANLHHTIEDDACEESAFTIFEATYSGSSG